MAVSRAGRRIDSGRQSVDPTSDHERIDEPVRAVFIRVPWVERVGSQASVLAAVNGHPVAVRQGSVLVTSFHPEVGRRPGGADTRVHRLFLDLVSAVAR